MATSAPAAAKFAPKIVHAYRRAPDMSLDGKERDVVVQCNGETVKFRSNETGHVVGTVTTKACYDRLVKEIPEAYIDYKGGDNVPAPGPVRIPEPPAKPAGKWVLSNGKDSVVLDEMDDAEVRAFAATAGLEEPHPDLAGDTLKQAVYNQCVTA